MSIAINKSYSMQDSKGEFKISRSIQNKEPMFQLKQEIVGDKVQILSSNKPEKDNVKNKKKNKPKESIWKQVVKGVKNFFGTINVFWGKIFGSSDKSKKRDDADIKAEQQCDFKVISSDYNNKKNGENKNKINDEQQLKIKKLGYTVKSGETLEQISERYGISVECLRELNSIAPEKQPKIGSVLEIPAGIYTVEANDNLTNIAKRLDIDVEKLQYINNLQSDSIYPGQNLVVLHADVVKPMKITKYGVEVDKTSSASMRSVKMDDARLVNRPLLQTKHIINDNVAATRNVFDPVKQGKLSGKTIIINAGHGYSQNGIDSGALGKKGVDDEWLCNYDNAMRLKDKLVNQGARVIFMQGHISIVKEELEKERNKADLFVSVHVNSFPKNTSDRTQIYFSTKDDSMGKEINTKSRRLAGIMEKNFDKWIPAHEKISNGDKFVNGGKQDYAQSVGEPLGVCTTAELTQNVPSVLWEVAFMGSRKGRERLTNESLLNDYAGVMANSIVEYFS